MLRVVQKPCYTIRTLDAIDEPEQVSDRAWLLITDTVEFGWKRLFGAGRLPHLFITVIGTPLLGPPPGSEDAKLLNYVGVGDPNEDQVGGLACCAIGMHMINVATGESLMQSYLDSPAISLAEWVRAVAVSVLQTLLVYKQEVDGDRRWTEDRIAAADAELDDDVENMAEELLAELLTRTGGYFGSN
jgi:hypothetical protein